MIADEVAIHKLRRAYAFCAARGDAAGIAELFTADGVFTFRQNGTWSSISGRAAIASALSALGPNEVFPLIQDGPTALEGGEGRGVCMIFSPISPSGEGFGGFYEESYRRCPDGAWRFTERRFVRVFPEADEPRSMAIGPDDK